MVCRFNADNIAEQLVTRNKEIRLEIVVPVKTVGRKFVYRCPFVNEYTVFCGANGIPHKCAGIFVDRFQLLEHLGEFHDQRAAFYILDEHDRCCTGVPDSSACAGITIIRDLFRNPCYIKVFEMIFDNDK